MTALASCTDSATSPRTAAPRNPASASPLFDFATSSSSLGSSDVEFKVGAAGGSFSIGNLYTINFPANSICDPSQSTYGPTEWDKDCITLAADQSVTIHATISLTSTGVAVDFTPALRFSPATVVTMATDIFASTIKANRDYYQKNPSALNTLAILYAPTLGATGLSDYAVDASIVTKVSLGNGRIWRRVKHFSGYSIVSGEACEPAPDNPDCVEVH